MERALTVENVNHNTVILFWKARFEEEYYGYRESVEMIQSIIPSIQTEHSFCFSWCLRWDGRVKGSISHFALTTDVSLGAQVQPG